MSTPVVIGKYEVLEAIGRGGFATVYKARDPLMRRLIAIKLCTEQDEDLRRRFLREAQIAGSLDHPSIVRGFDCGYDEAGVYLVEEYLDGEDLKQKIFARSPIPYLKRLTILLEVANAIAYAHSKGVYHRDIKPGNIRILDSGRVKIMDFGIAKSSSSNTPLTKAGTLLGTAGYVAPEQVLGKPVDHRVDVFAFGALAYEFLTYHRPFTGQNVSERLRSVLDTIPEPIAKYWSDCPPSLEKAIERSLEKDPKSRYQNFGEVIADLQKVVEELKSAEEEVTSTLVQTAPAPADPATSIAPRDTGDLTAPPPSTSPVRQLGPAFEATILVPPESPDIEQLASPPPPSPPPPLPRPAPSIGGPTGAGAVVDQTLVAPVEPPPSKVAAAERPRPTVAAPSPAAVATAPPPPAAVAQPARPGVAVEPPLAGARRGSLTSALAGIPHRWLFAGIGVLILGIAVAILLVARDRGERNESAALPTPAPAPVAAAPSSAEPVAAATGQLIVSASPWGDLLAVIGSEGKPVETPKGAATPLILTLPPGEYEVRVARPGDAGKPGTCRATVVAATPASCRIELGRITPHEYFKAAGWWQ